METHIAVHMAHEQLRVLRGLEVQHACSLSVSKSASKEVLAPRLPHAFIKANYRTVASSGVD